MNTEQLLSLVMDGDSEAQAIINLLKGKAMAQQSLAKAALANGADAQQTAMLNQSMRNAERILDAIAGLR